MPGNPPPGRQNDRVTPPRRARRALLAVLLVPVLALTGCGAEKPKSQPTASPSVDLPTGNVQVPEGVTLTKAGTTLALRQPAVVAYEPNSQRSSVLSLSVDAILTGRISDFAAYQLDARTRASRPYYVRVTVKNVGAGDLSRSPVPLLAVDTRNTLIQPSSFNNSFGRCPSQPLPAGFAPTHTVRMCLVYLVPAGGTLTAMSFRPLQAFEPIIWKGTIQPAPVPKKPATKKKAKR